MRESNSVLGKNVRFLRIERGFSQMELTRRLNDLLRRSNSRLVSQPKICDIEAISKNGRIRVDVLIALSRIFLVSVDDMINVDFAIRGENLGEEKYRDENGVEKSHRRVRNRKPGRPIG